MQDSKGAEPAKLPAIVPPTLCQPMRLADGQLRHGRLWWPQRTEPVAMLCIAPGLGEHGGRYEDFVPPFLTAGWGVAVLDLQGQGLSPGRRGCIHSYDSLLADVAACLDLARGITDPARFISANLNTANLNTANSPATPRLDIGRLQALPGRKVFLYGHSMGGNLVLNTALRLQVKLDGAISSSPMLRAVRPLSRPAMAVARTLLRFMPNYQLKAPVRTEYLSRDADALQKYRDDSLVHRLVSLRLGAALIDSGVWALENAETLAVPTLLMHGLADPITDARASQEFARRAGNCCEAKFFPDLLHDIHREIGRQDVFDAIFAWLDRQLSKSC
jgi:acylglycerol lipase